MREAETILPPIPTTLGTSPSLSLTEDKGHLIRYLTPSPSPWLSPVTNVISPHHTQVLGNL